MASQTSESVATAIRVALTRRRMTGKALGQHLGLGQKTISRRLTGIVPFKADELVRVADLLGLAVDDLLADVGRAAGNSGQHTVSPASSGDAGSRERLDGPAAYHDQAAS